MYKTRLFLLFIIFEFVLIIAGLVRIRTVFAGIDACKEGTNPTCWESVWIEQWACPTCSDEGFYCTNKVPIRNYPCSQATAWEDCGAYTTCRLYCPSNPSWSPGSCSPFSMFVFCDTNIGHCDWSGTMNDCEWRGGVDCSEVPSSTETRDCCTYGEPVPPPPAPSCTWSPWENAGDCGTMGCALTERPQTRTTSPDNCTSEFRCDPAPNPPCTCNSFYTPGVCGAPNCPVGQRYYVLNENPPGCDLVNPDDKCQYDPTCPQPATCSCTAESLTAVTMTGLGVTSDPDGRASFTPSAGCSIDNSIGVSFSIVGPPIVSMTAAYPNPDKTPTYDVEFQSVAYGSTTYQAKATLNDGNTCTVQAPVIVSSSLNGWWQVKQGDAIAGGSLSNLKSDIPCAGCRLIENQGISIAGGTFTLGTDTTTPKVSTSIPYSGKEYLTYDNFKTKSPIAPTSVDGSVIAGELNQASLTSLGVLTNGFYWLVYDGSSDLTLKDADGTIDLGGRKIVFYVNNNPAPTLLLGSKIINGYFYVFSRGDIKVVYGIGDPPTATPDVDIKGVFYTDGIFYSTTNSTNVNNQLYIKGSVVGKSGINLGRKLGSTDNGIYPAEVFDIAPDLILSWPKDINVKKTLWKELAP